MTKSKAGGVAVKWDDDEEEEEKEEEREKGERNKVERGGRWRTRWHRNPVPTSCCV